MECRPSRRPLMNLVMRRAAPEKQPEMKNLYARFVLWLIRPALNLRANCEAEYARRVMDAFHSANPPRKLAPELFN